MKTDFDTLTEFVDYVVALPGDGSENDSPWAGGHYRDIVRFGREGWPEGARKASELATRIVDRLVVSPGASESLHYDYDVTGMSFDMGEVLAGTPEAWLACKPFDDKKAVHIVANIDASGGIPTDVMVNRGVAVSALALALQTKGYAVTVDVVTGASNQRIRVADATSGSQLDLDRVVFALGHPGFFRHLTGFAYEGRKFNLSGGKWGRQHPTEYTGDVRDEANLYIGMVHYSTMDRWNDGGEDWVISEFKRQTEAV